MGYKNKGEDTKLYNIRGSSLAGEDTEAPASEISNLVNNYENRARRKVLDEPISAETFG